MNVIQQFPHCDPRVLHAPGECKYCDDHPEWQELRQAWNIAFTGHEPEGPNGKDELPDPAEWYRPLETINAWDGNRPRQ